MENDIITEEKLLSTIQSSCKHVAFIQKKFINSTLHLSHPDVMNSKGDRCFIPACNTHDFEKLKAFWHMGKPPKKTYLPINYVGIGLHAKSQNVTDDWYTAYVPINLKRFNGDKYLMSRQIISVIEHGSFNVDSCFSQIDVDNVLNKNKSDSSSYTSSNDSQCYRTPFHKSNEAGEFGIFATPSCMYATKCELATPLEFDGFDVNLQIIIQARVKPYSFKLGPATISQLPTRFDCCFPNSEIEWYIENSNDIVPQRLLFKLIKRQENKDSMPDQHLKLLLVMPSTKDIFNSADFTALKRHYSSTFNPLEEAITMDSNINKIILKIKWTSEHNKMTYYLKTLIDGKNLEWCPEKKYWKANPMYMYEAIKFGASLSLKVNDSLLYDLWKWLTNLSLSGMPCEFNKLAFLNWIISTPIWTLQRIQLVFGPKVQAPTNANPIRNLTQGEFKETLSVDMMPFNKEIVATFKKRNSNTLTYTWNAENKCWSANDFNILMSDLLATLPQLKPYSDKDIGILENRGMNLKLLTKRKSSTSIDRTPRKRASQETEIESDFSTVSKILLTVAAEKDHFDRLVQKVQRVVETISAPTSSISASGKIVMGGAGTGGIEFIESPRDLEIWNKMSICIVPNETKGQIPVNQYNCNLLASLVGEVFIIKEKAIDHLLANYKQWPGPNDQVDYTRWNEMLVKNEPKCWGGETFDGRQRLAQSRLFCDEDFYIQGSQENVHVLQCQLLIKLGNGKITTDPKDAEYVIITDAKSLEAADLYKRFGCNDEDKIAATHGARHSTLVTPKYIYDCILQWQLQRPQHCHGHYAF
ncbi:bifunctional BRCT domain superfamily/BRCT domain [Babesia duncani]|uniref:Bifunctional BRCT domain superfamily/BRCT domain n=1 Tax=Babesia duncani TaxID=323732 RepID=A0AAD9PI35_9APIC|nr:bifunctional BRCT domain superfamily/BRCT domain [Babesia duncani]